MASWLILLWWVARLAVEWVGIEFFTLRGGDGLYIHGSHPQPLPRLREKGTNSRLEHSGVGPKAFIQKLLQFLGEVVDIDMLPHSAAQEPSLIDEPKIMVLIVGWVHIIRF